MYLGHPYDCTKRKFPMPCPRCNDLVVYWECYHDSKVFFDDLGPHDCSPRSASAYNLSPLGPRRSGTAAWETLEGISESVQPDDFDLLPGMTRFRSSIVQGSGPIKV